MYIVMFAYMYIMVVIFPFYYVIMLCILCFDI